jgi:predicted AlkP superfamily pyrophosphatase or phosphodiesterase
MRRVRAGIAAAVAATLGMAGSVQAAPAAAPKLIVAISIDQFSWDLFNAYRTTYTGGLKRLAGGIAYTGYQSHAGTETCPGHSTILTGRHPSGTGIVANSWYDRASGKMVYCVAVPGADAEARGPQTMHVDTFGDWLKKSTPGSRVVAISGKDRAAITMAGKTADAVYWWNDGEGFVTSSYAGPATPAVVDPAKAFNTALFDRWRTQPPQLWPTKFSPKCAALQKPETFGTLKVSGEVPPEGAEASTKASNFLTQGDFEKHLRASPTFDRQVLDFASTIIDRDHLGHGPATDVLALSFSANDYIGHRYGPGGAEMCVQQAAIDQTLGRLFVKLDGLKVPYMVVLTADHGGSDAVERAVQNGVAARRVDGIAMLKQLKAAVGQQLGIASVPIASDDLEQIYIATGTDPALKAKVIEATVAWLKTQPDIDQVYTAEQVAAAVPPRGKPVADLSIVERMNESYDAERSADISVAFKPHVVLYAPKKPGDTVAGHGSPWDYDRRVPILFWWKGVRPQSPSTPIETVDIAPTLAAIANVAMPVRVWHRCDFRLQAYKPRRSMAHARKR